MPVTILPGVPTPPSRPLTPAQSALGAVLDQHTSLSPQERDLLVTTLGEARSVGPTERYNVQVWRDHFADDRKLVEGIPQFAGFPESTRDEVAHFVERFRGRRFVSDVQDHGPFFRLTLGMRNRHARRTYAAVSDWNGFIARESVARPELAALKLKLGKDTEGLLLHELRAKLGDA